MHRKRRNKVSIFLTLYKKCLKIGEKEKCREAGKEEKCLETGENKKFLETGEIKKYLETEENKKCLETGKTKQKESRKKMLLGFFEFSAWVVAGCHRDSYKTVVC